jgi:hypothetical protein
MPSGHATVTPCAFGIARRGRAMPHSVRQGDEPMRLVGQRAQTQERLELPATATATAGAYCYFFFGVHPPSQHKILDICLAIIRCFPLGEQRLNRSREVSIFGVRSRVVLGVHLEAMLTWLRWIIIFKSSMGTNQVVCGIVRIRLAAACYAQCF